MPLYARVLKSYTTAGPISAILTAQRNSVFSFFLTFKLCHFCKLFFNGFPNGRSLYARTRVHNNNAFYRARASISAHYHIFFLLKICNSGFYIQVVFYFIFIVFIEYIRRLISIKLDIKCAISAGCTKSDSRGGGGTHTARTHTKVTFTNIKRKKTSRIVRRKYPRNKVYYNSYTTISKADFIYRKRVRIKLQIKRPYIICEI